MNRLIKIILIIFFSSFILHPSSLFAQAKVGTAGLQFLKVGVSARAVGMGEAFTAVANDASALYYNPAGLIQLTKPEATFTLINYPADIKFIYIGGIIPTPITSGVLGIQMTSLFTDDMIETTPSMIYGTGRTFTASDLAAAVTYCQRLTNKFSVGASFKYLSEHLANATANGWSADVGTFYTTGWKKINIGMVIQNFGADMKFEDTPFPLPIIFKFGASMTALEKGPYSLLLSGEFLHPNDNVEIYNIGAEFSYMRMFSLRFGKRVNALVRDSWLAYDEDSQRDPFVEYPLFEKDYNGDLSLVLDGVSFGVGVKIPEAGVNIDYAWGGLGTLGGAHRFTIGYMLAGRLF
ncbi:MAG: PorV/PorQ family protein [Candidatus Hatepunaea meridiana]|nr:PorV/PorQ family protein [Candidatus Hatepunaea meridiana]